MFRKCLDTGAGWVGGGVQQESIALILFLKIVTLSKTYSPNYNNIIITLNIDH